MINLEAPKSFNFELAQTDPDCVLGDWGSIEMLTSTIPSSKSDARFRIIGDEDGETEPVQN